MICEMICESVNVTATLVIIPAAAAVFVFQFFCL
jgi:hypothetical protein